MVAGGVQGGARLAREVNTGAEAEREAIVWCDGLGDGRCSAAVVRRADVVRSERRCARDVLVRSECRDVQTTRDHTFSGASRQLRLR